MAKVATNKITPIVPVKRRTGRPRLDEPREADVHVGRRLRQRRTILGMSQEKLGDAIGLTFQQIQKYERGANRIGASRLLDVATALQVPVGYFFEGIGTDQPDNGKDDPMNRRETLEMVRAYWRISDPHVRASVYAHIKALAGKAA